ncbi:MAG: beta-ketoacyl-ACP synthase II [Thermoguttaceae bacterium]
MTRRKVVITGMGTINALGAGVGTFWEGIKSGKSGVGPILKFDPEGLPCRIAAEVKDFKPTDYLEHKLVQRTALFSQFALIAANEAWKDAKLDDPEFSKEVNMERVAVLLGTGIGGLDVDTEAQRKLFEKGPSRIPAMTIPKMIANEAAGNVSMHFGTKGMAHTIVTACASGTDAIGHALSTIQSGRAEIVLTGGTEGSITQFGIGGFCALKALSTGYNDQPEKASRPFDKDRDGFVMGEGAGILILEEFEHAKKRGATIYAELGGFGATADAFHLTAPDPDGEGAARAIRLAIEDAGVEINEVDYINAHGTSTPTNDPIETTAIKKVFGDHAYKLKVSSTKGATGHCLGAAGAIEAIACVEAIRAGFFPPTLNLDEPDPLCDLDYVPKVGRSGDIRVAVSTSLGFGGHNSVLVIKKN